MAGFRDLIADVIKSGPENVKAIIGALDKLPKEETLLQLVDALDKFYPYMPLLEKAIESKDLDKLVALAQKLPGKKTLEDIIALAQKLEPHMDKLDKLPEGKTLDKLLENLEPLIQVLNNMEE